MGGGAEGGLKQILSIPHQLLVVKSCWQWRLEDIELGGLMMAGPGGFELCWQGVGVRLDSCQCEVKKKVNFMLTKRQLFSIKSISCLIWHYFLHLAHLEGLGHFLTAWLQTGPGQ